MTDSKRLQGYRGVKPLKEFESGGEGASDGESSNSPRTWFVLIAIGIALVTAFRWILIAPFGWVEPRQFEYWFFIPNRDSGAIALLVMAWFLWNRRGRLSASRDRQIGWGHAAAAIVVLSLYCWAAWSRTQALLIPAFCMTLATLASAWGGRAAFRMVGLPCIALLLAFPPPPPLQAEIIWRLQVLTAEGANLLLTLAGYAVQLEGTELRFGGYAFVIIEACSGWRGIQVLTLVGLAASELQVVPLRRAFGVVLFAVPLGIGLNVIRACLVMLTQEELKAEFFDSHTPQGIAVLFVGSVILYGCAALLTPKSQTTRVMPRKPQVTPPATGSFLRWAAFSLGLSLTLVVVSVVIPFSKEPAVGVRPYNFSFPITHLPWRGTNLGLDFFFPYSTPTNPQLHVEYRNLEAELGAELVDLFIARETPTSAGLDRMPDAKLLLPASDWTLISRDPARVWQFGLDAEEAIASREGGSARSYVLAWRVRDVGLLRESLRSLVGIRGCDTLEGKCTRIVFRITVPILHNDDRGSEHARRTADRFIDHFVLPLKIVSLP